ncbi:sodium channel regulatory subunit beta-3 isoform X3 [Austrofundulus limnaeus]|uniref:Sodium channel regulatory subunit beta-3 n=1 Tax=Austrofundulus limnaeus TaxID=52670 RepID=A0A2I4AYY7_AUSLI|nr:PREDICTED: sodium channel subunit beta-3 isoform X3 [Austrofundulus limnaeus]
MVTLYRVQLQTLVLLFFLVHLSRPVCVDVLSDTEAVLGTSKKLTCISCMLREEVKAKTYVSWFYMREKNTSNKTHIYQYNYTYPVEVDGPFLGRLAWNGSQDLQDVSISILNVTYSDRGIYECHIHREFDFGFFNHKVSVTKTIELEVKEKASKDPTAFYSQIMMYVLLVFLTFWLLVEMVYCYRKISKSDEQTQDTAY